ncbi:MAG TPA: exonuclease domain-containing protein [Opitutales bacterium]|nr:exonuclease domain-containing protein [Opitutales bacterium]
MIRLPANLVVIDCETTGLDAAWHGIVSIGAVALDGSEFHQECQPGGEVTDVDAEALAVCGIADLQALYSREMAAGPAVLKLCEWLRGLPRAGLARKDKFIQGGKNPHFDREFLVRELSRWRRGQTPEDFKEEQTLAGLRKWAENWLPLSRRPLNVHDWAVVWALRRGIAVDAPGFSVAQVYRQLGFAEEAKPHHALTGAKLALEKFKKLAEEL